jgi:hypothetical protein
MYIVLSSLPILLVLVLASIFQRRSTKSILGKIEAQKRRRQEDPGSNEGETIVGFSDGGLCIPRNFGPRATPLPPQGQGVDYSTTPLPYKTDAELDAALSAATFYTTGSPPYAVLADGTPINFTDRETALRYERRGTRSVQGSDHQVGGSELRPAGRGWHTGSMATTTSITNQDNGGTTPQKGDKPK